MKVVYLWILLSLKKELCTGARTFIHRTNDIDTIIKRCHATSNRSARQMKYRFYNKSKSECIAIEIDTVDDLKKIVETAYQLKVKDIKLNIYYATIKFEDSDQPDLVISAEYEMGEIHLN